MNTRLREAMRNATRLTSSGDLQGATAAIQSSLRAGMPSARPDFGTDRSSPHGQRDGTVTHSAFSSHGIDLEYRLFTPSAVTGPAPLLIMLHGCTQDADDFAIGTGMDALASSAGLQVLYPSQSVLRNSRKCWNWFEPAHQLRGGGEVAALHALSEMVASRRNVDPGHVFVAGMSAGGAMALLLAEEYPELIAGVGVHSGLPSGVAKSVPQALSAMQGKRCPPANRMSPVSAAPAIIFHGDSDNTVHPCNAAQIVAARVANTDTTTIMSEGSQAGRTFRRCEYRTSDDQVACEYWELGGSGHRWSGGNPAGSHTDQEGPSASAEMLRFFLQVARTS